MYNIENKDAKVSVAAAPRFTVCLNYLSACLFKDPLDKNPVCSDWSVLIGLSPHASISALLLFLRPQLCWRLYNFDITTSQKIWRLISNHRLSAFINKKRQWQHGNLTFRNMESLNEWGETPEPENFSQTRSLFTLVYQKMRWRVVLWDTEKIQFICCC